MAGLASEISGTQMVEFFARFGRFGGNLALFQQLLGNDELMKQWVEQLIKGSNSDLVHGVFNKQDDVLAAFKARCTAKSIDFGKFSWTSSEQAPDFDPNDPETVVVLDATLDTLQSTFEFAWEWTTDGQSASWRWPGLVSDPSKLALLDGLEFKPWTLRWVRIKLDANVGRKPIDVRDSRSSPGCALLFMSAEHPARIKATDYKSRFGFWIPGLKCTAPDDEAWQGVVVVYFSRGDSQVRVYANDRGHGYSGYSVPVLRE